MVVGEEGGWSALGGGGVGEGSDEGKEVKEREKQRQREAGKEGRDGVRKSETKR